MTQDNTTKRVIIDLGRRAYSADSVTGAITIGQLIEALQEFDEDALVITRFDNGYTYGRITSADIFDECWLAPRNEDGMPIH